jgi:23S rRNA (cytidine1920-2'-O)/16S rRNA (cytidine1409-2'-O)-methyltransferase
MRSLRVFRGWRPWPVTLPRMPTTTSKRRLDSLLADRGLFASRSRAAAAIASGKVRLGADGPPVAKPGQMVPRDAAITVERGDEYVSRGGVKLANAFGELALDPAGRMCLDVGASTGGFTDCLLQRGAGHVVALDVAAGELHGSLRGHPRITVVERVNARAIEAKSLPYRPDLIVVDVSFISLTKVLPAVLGCAAAEFDCLALVKPQFELDRGRVGKGGVVRAPEDRRAALVSVGECVRALGCSLRGFVSSELPGPAGNRESFAWITAGGDPHGVQDVQAAAAKVEP